MRCLLTQDYTIIIRLNTGSPRLLTSTVVRWLKATTASLTYQAIEWEILAAVIIILLMYSSSNSHIKLFTDVFFDKLKSLIFDYYRVFNLNFLFILRIVSFDTDRATKIAHSRHFDVSKPKAKHDTSDSEYKLWDQRKFNKKKSRFRFKFDMQTHFYTSSTDRRFAGQCALWRRNFFVHLTMSIVPDFHPVDGRDTIRMACASRPCERANPDRCYRPRRGFGPVCY